MGKKEETLAWLDNKGVEYVKVEHEAVYTMDEMLVLGLDKRGVLCKNLFLRDAKGKRHFLVVAHNDTPVNLKELGELVGSKLSFASEDRLQKYLNLSKGAVSPLGIMYDKEGQVEIILDSNLQGANSLGIHPCDNTATIFILYSDLHALVEGNGNLLTTL